MTPVSVYEANENIASPIGRDALCLPYSGFPHNWQAPFMLIRREGSIAVNFLPCITDHNTKEIRATQSVHVPYINSSLL